MTNILLNVYDFDANWAYDILQKNLKPRMSACILTMSHGTEIPDAASWEKVYAPGGHIYQDLLRPFEAYGIQAEHISWVSWYHDTPETAAEKVEQADVLFLTGGLPDVFYRRLEAFGLIKRLRAFPGVVIGASAGAMVQFQEYHITPDEDYDTYGYYPGLGLLDGFELEVHYTGAQVQRESIQRYQRERSKPVYAMYNDGGLLVQQGNITRLGRVVQFPEGRT